MVFAGDTEGFVYHFIFVYIFIMFTLHREDNGSILRTGFLVGGAFAAGMLLSAAVVVILLELIVNSVSSSRSIFNLDFYIDAFNAPFHLTAYFFALPFKYNKHFNPSWPVQVSVQRS